MCKINKEPFLKHKLLLYNYPTTMPPCKRGQKALPQGALGAFGFTAKDKRGRAYVVAKTAASCQDEDEDDCESDEQD